MSVVARIRVADHPTNPRYQVGQVAGRQVVTGKHYVDGQLGVFVPEGYLVPEGLLREMWLWNDAQRKGRLGGVRGNRVKSKVMDGVLSEGLFYGQTWFDWDGVLKSSERWNPSWVEGDHVGCELGVISPAMSLTCTSDACVFESENQTAANGVLLRLRRKFPANKFWLAVGPTWKVQAAYEPGVAQDMMAILREARR